MDETWNAVVYDNKHDFADTIIGVDSSENMIEKARKQYTDIKFMVCDALALPFEKQFDVVSAHFKEVPKRLLRSRTCRKIQTHSGGRK
jgi:trans-aconitate methyltransferase